jgi:hypothetical protein
MCDDFEMIADLGSTNDPTFELINVNDDLEHITDMFESGTSELNRSRSISPALFGEVDHSVQASTPMNSPIELPIQQEQQSLLHMITPVTSFISQMPTKSTTSNSSIATSIRKLPPVPSLSNAPAPKRYGDAATIPHNLCETLDINDVINKSRTHRENILNVSLRDQQQQDIQVVLEQRRLILNKNLNY